MRHPKGFLPVAVVLVAVVVALVVAGASYWYTKDKNEEVVNTNTAVVTNTNTAVNENVNTAANSNTNAATNVNTAVNGNTNSVVNTNVSTGTSTTYTSATQGITFTYAPTYAEKKVLIKENASTLYVYTADMQPEAGQFVRLFTKTASTSLKTAIEQQFLKGYSSADCFVVTPDTYSATKMGSGWNTARIAYPPAAANAENPWIGAEKCPKVYTASNGLSFFAEDKDDPTKFFFFSIGQYMIPAGSATVGAKGWEETVTVDPTAGWKTYTNAEFGYSIRYPKAWPIEPQHTSIKSVVTIGNTPAEPSAGPFSIYVKKNDTNVDAFMISHKQSFPDGCGTETSLSFAGSTWKVVDCKEAFAGANKKSYVTSQQGSIYHLYYIEGSSSINSTFETILSTFKFLDDTSGWKTYTGNGISIKYPPEWNVNANIDVRGYQYNMIGFRKPDLGSDYNWGISRYSTSEKTVEEVIADIGRQFNDRKESRETITLAGVPAQKVTVTTETHNNWEAIQIVFQKAGIIYDISNGAVLNDMYNSFYQSFKFVD